MKQALKMQVMKVNDGQEYYMSSYKMKRRVAENPWKFKALNENKKEAPKDQVGRAK